MTRPLYDKLSYDTTMMTVRALQKTFIHIVSSRIVLQSSNVTTTARATFSAHKSSTPHSILGRFSYGSYDGGDGGGIQLDERSSP